MQVMLKGKYTWVPVLCVLVVYKYVYGNWWLIIMYIKMIPNLLTVGFYLRLLNKVSRGGALGWRAEALTDGWEWRTQDRSLTGYENRVWEEWKQSQRGEKCHSGLNGNAGIAARSATVTNSFANIEQCSSFSIKRSSRHLYFIIWLQAVRGEEHLTGLQAAGTVRREETSKIVPSAGLFLPEMRWRSHWRTNGLKLQHKLTSSQWQPQESKYEHFSPVWCFNTTIVTYANWPYQELSWPDDL